MKGIESAASWTKLSLFPVTWPIFIDSVLRMMLGTADVFMLSRISDEVTGAVGLANEIIVFCILMFGFVGIGTSVAVAQHLGAGKVKEASHISALAITINFIFGAIVSIALITFAEPLMHLMNLAPEQIAIAKKYLNLISAFIWIEALSYAISSILRSNGHTRDVMYVTLGVNVIHVVGNSLLIFGNLGFPEWGVTGAAVSTIVSRLAGLIVLLVILYRRLQVPILLKHYMSFDRRIMKQILSVGLPAAGEHISWQSQYLMIFSFINIIGATALSAHVYVMNVTNYFISLGMAIGMGTEIIVGHMVGAGAFKEAYHKLLRSLKITFLVTFIVVSITAIFRKGLLGLFTENQDIIAMGSMILLLSIILEPGRTFNLVVINSLRAAGDARFPVLMGVVSMWGIAVPLAYWLGIRMEMGLLGVWIAFTADEWVRGLLMYVRWRSRIWQTKALVKPHGETIAS
ncbi:MATE family efflux transporter [Paenibacillus roseipurpureus]|uniref:MATE family efflux transporter n=1 Tax=Paenibacillus roseopurpureus TaxID=2918901 RepID=A0AA96RHB3_9BACL|nr:MATE family efflux transporter [Paenibacillus sp. MBLB1832]WNR43143.1 MATE family efflux transporter [Paenibacillus sp. MBLB1832]